MKFWVMVFEITESMQSNHYFLDKKIFLSNFAPLTYALTKRVRSYAINASVVQRIE